MEEERCPFGLISTVGTEVGAGPVAQGPIQHPTGQIDIVSVPEPQGHQDKQQSCVSSESQCDGDLAIPAGGKCGAPCTAAMSDPKQPLPSTDADPEGTEDIGGIDIDASGSLEGGTATERVLSDGADIDAKPNAGTQASPARRLRETEVATEEAVTEVSSAGPVTCADDPNSPNALADETGDAGGADSDGKESNDSVCNECGGGGEVVCCDGCVKSYHSDCLPVAARPRLRANADDWFCPDCTSSLAAPAPAAAAPSSGSLKAHQGCSESRGSRQNTAPASPSPVYPAPAPSTPWTALPSCLPTRRRKTKATEDYETRINVGPNHQVPHLPDFFLARGDSDSVSTIAEQPLVDGAQSQALGPLLVYSPYLMERSKQQCLSERAAKSCITSQKDLAEFLIKCSKRWKVRPGWQPFSPEFAYKLLHRANYDPERALRMMDDSAFCFQSICDPPLRKYDNKWKRRDKRGTFPNSPYPPPVVVRGYLNEKQRQLRMGR